MEAHNNADKWRQDSQIKLINRHKRCSPPFLKGQLRTLFTFVCGFIFAAFLLQVINYTQYAQQQYSGNLRSTGESLASNLLLREVRILCMVLTNPANHEQYVHHISATWGRRCTKLLFVSSVGVEELDIVRVVEPAGETYHDLWNKTREGFRYVYENYIDEYDWFLKADDDTYIIIENLRLMLYAYSADMPIYFGYKMERYDVQYMSGGASYLLSRESLRRFILEAFNNTKICPPAKKYAAEDFYMGICLQNVGVHLIDTKDTIIQDNRIKQFPLDLQLFAVENAELPEWFLNMSVANIKIGIPNCCSNYGIGFHYILPTQMYTFEYLIYQLRVFGISVNSASQSDPTSEVLQEHQLPSRLTWAEVSERFPSESNKKIADLQTMSDRPDNF